MDKIIPPYVMDKEHNAPKYMLVQVYPQLSMNRFYTMKEIEKRVILQEENVE